VSSPLRDDDREASEPEASLLESCRAGDPEAFRRLVERHQDRVYTLALHLSRNESAAAEIVQSAFVRAFRSIHRFRGEARFQTWLHRIVVNAWRDEWRRTRRFVPLDEASDLPIESGRGPEHDSAARQERSLVWKAVARLPERLRLPLVLRYLEDLSYEEIGRVLRCRQGTVASRLHRAHARLARSLAVLDRPEVRR